MISLGPSLYQITFIKVWGVSDKMKNKEIEFLNGKFNKHSAERLTISMRHIFMNLKR